jgi:hypothetical protein
MEIYGVGIQIGFKIALSVYKEILKASVRYMKHKALVFGRLVL